MDVSPELNQHINNIMDVFSGGDNAKFYSFKLTMEEIYIKAEDGDDAAEQILDIVRKFSKLLNAVHNQQMALNSSCK